MSKQDRQGVRKPSDIEQKYGLGEFMYNQRQSNKEMSKCISDLGESLSTHKTETNENISKLKENTDNQIKQVNESIGNVAKDIESLSKEIFNMVYPVGAIYISVSATNPSTLFGGTWEQIKDRFLLAAGSAYKAGATGGNEKHKHTEGDFRAMIGAATGSPSTLNYVSTGGSNPNTGATRTGTYTIVGASYRTGDGFAHYTPVVGYTSTDSNMPPYLAVCVWKRTA